MADNHFLPAARGLGRTASMASAKAPTSHGTKKSSGLDRKTEKLESRKARKQQRLGRENAILVSTMSMKRREQTIKLKRSTSDSYLLQLSEDERREMIEAVLADQRRRYMLRLSVPVGKPPTKAEQRSAKLGLEGLLRIREATKTIPALKERWYEAIWRHLPGHRHSSQKNSSSTPKEHLLADALRRSRWHNAASSVYGNRKSGLLWKLSAHLVRGHVRPKPNRQVEKQDDGSPSSIDFFMFRFELHRSSLSVVYAAFDPVAKRPVCIKAYEKAKLNVKLRARVQQEISVLSSTRHEAMLRFISTFEDATSIYIVTENCGQGDVLRDLTLSKKGYFEDETAVCLILKPLLQLLRVCLHTTCSSEAGGLQVLHGRRLCHRDIKPENILLGNGGCVRLADFWLTLDLGASEVIFERVGTLDYMPPEMLMVPTQEELRRGVDDNDDRPLAYNEKVDIWQVGVLTYELLVGRPPFEVPDPDLAAALILWGQLETFPPRVSEKAQDFIQKALTKDPELRPSAKRLLNHPWLKTMTFKSAVQTVATSLDIDMQSAAPRHRRSKRERVPFFMRVLNSTLNFVLGNDAADGSGASNRPAQWFSTNTDAAAVCRRSSQGGRRSSQGSKLSDVRPAMPDPNSKVPLSAVRPWLSRGRLMLPFGNPVEQPGREQPGQEAAARHMAAAHACR